MALPDTARNIFGAVKFGDLSLVVITATIASGAATRVAASSSPGTTIVKNGTGTYDVTFPPGSFFLPVSADVVIADPTGSKGYPAAFDADAGTATYEFAVTPGTAADPADSTMCISFWVGQT